LRWYYNRADGVIAVSSEVVDELKKFGIYKPIYLVPNTIDTSVFATDGMGKSKARELLGISHEAFLVMCSGQVQPRKGVATFIACAKALPEYKFVWVGGIPFGKVAADHKEMEKLMQEHPDNLQFTGIVSRDKIVDYYQASDLFFLPSHQETFGLVIVEAAAAGVPVLLRDIPQYLKTFKSFYTAGTEENFPELIHRFAQDKAFYADEQAKAHKIAEMYDSKQGAERLIEVYTAVIEGRLDDQSNNAK
jgi:1,2-diacylglycerol-3-alpha-glucose alpha-1,2-galactosyltransferase